MDTKPTVADRVIEWCKRAGESTPKELETALGIKQTELAKACEVALREGALVKRAHPRFKCVTYAIGPNADCWKPLRSARKAPLPRPEHVGKQIEAAKNSAWHVPPNAAPCDAAPRTKPEVVDNPGSLGGASSRITPRRDEAVAIAQQSETPPATLQPADLAPGAAKSGVGDDTQEGEAIVAKTVGLAITDAGKLSITINDEHVFVLDPALTQRVGGFFGKTEGVWRA